MYQKFLNGETTAAGSFPPSKILVIGAGVAGLAAIGAGKNLGAIVRAFDTRMECKDQVEVSIFEYGVGVCTRITFLISCLFLAL
jgi:NAD/NADP transhydrogenase alpha subunit